MTRIEIQVAIWYNRNANNPSRLAANPCGRTQVSTITNILKDDLLYKTCEGRLVDKDELLETMPEETLLSPADVRVGQVVLLNNAGESQGPAILSEVRLLYQVRHYKGYGPNASLVERHQVTLSEAPNLLAAIRCVECIPSKSEWRITECAPTRAVFETPDTPPNCANYWIVELVVSDESGTKNIRDYDPALPKDLEART